MNSFRTMTMKSPPSSSPWHAYDLTLQSRILLGTAQYPSPDQMKRAIVASGTELVTVSVRRQAPETRAGKTFWELIKSTGVDILPNTAGCRTAKEAITTALMAREIFETPRVKLEVIGDDYTLEPDPMGTVEAARELTRMEFQVFPYTTENLGVAEHLVEAGCQVIMPWASPIGSGQGILNPSGLQTLRERLPHIALVVDAGLGKPSEAARVLEWGYDAVLCNTAIALADNPAEMATAFSQAVVAGNRAFTAGLMPVRNMATPSTPTLDTPFWQQEETSPS